MSVVKVARPKQSYVSKAVLPRRCGWENEREFERNQGRSLPAMKKYRYAYRLLFQTPSVRKYCRQIGLKEPDTYNKRNQHGGVMFALPSEFTLTDKQAGKIMFKAYRAHTLTFVQLKVIRKMLSYAYQLKGHGPKTNWPSIPGVWDVVNEKKCADQKNFVLPTRIPRADQLKAAFTGKGWSPELGVSLLNWSRGCLLAWCWGVLGARSEEDLKRIKDGDAHGSNAREGWAWSKFHNGRCKLPGKKANTRPWRAWFVCLCKGGKHVPVQADIEYYMDANGNATVPVTYQTGCPVACHELVVRCHWRDNFGLPGQDEAKTHVRIFNSWTKGKKFSGQGNGPTDLVALAFEWLKLQGVEETFDRNAGRKALSQWCHKLRIPYHESVQIHGDTESVWGGSYQKRMPPSGYKERRQSNVASVATMALRKFALILCKRGLAWKPDLTRPERFIHAFLEAKGEKERAYRIAHDLPSEDDDSDDELSDGFAN